MIELTVVLGIIVLLTAIAVGSFVGMRQRLAIKTATRQVSAVISMARNSAIATRAASRVVATNVASKQMGGAQHSGPTPGPVAWQGKVIAEVPEVISQWAFESMYEFIAVRPTPSPTRWPTPNPSPPDSFIGTHGNLAVAYGQIADLDDSGSPIDFTPGQIYLNPLVDAGARPLGNFLRLYPYDASSFSEASPRFDLIMPGTNPIDYALPPDDLRTEAVLAPTPPPPSPPAWWSMYSNNQRYLGRPGMRFEAWVMRRPTPSLDRSARVLFAKPAGTLTSGGYDTRMDYLIEIWPDATPTPKPNVFTQGYDKTGIKHGLNAQLYACFRDHIPPVTPPPTPTVDAAYSGRFGIPAGEWTHIMVSWNPAAADRADRLSLYINWVKRTQLCKAIHYSAGNRWKAKEDNPVPFISTPARFTPPAINNYEQDYEPDDENIVDAFEGWLKGVKISRIISRSAALTDVVRFALPGDPATVAQRASFGWDQEGRLIDDWGSVISASNLVIIIPPKFTRLYAGMPRPNPSATPTPISVSSVAKFTPAGLLAIGTLEDPEDPRSGFQLKELVSYGAKDRGGGGTPDRFLECTRGSLPVLPGEAHPAGSAVFQAILARVGLKGEVRIDDGAQ